MSTTNQDSKDVKEVTLYNFSTIRNAEYLSKEALNKHQSFICYDESLFDLEIPISDKGIFDKKTFLNFEKLKTKRKKDEVKGIEHKDELIQITLNNIFDRIMYLYNSKSDNFYEINNLLLGLKENKDVIIDLKSINLSILQKKVWLSFVYNLKYGNDFKQKEIATNLLRFFHLKKYRNLIDDESTKEKLENFDILINAQIVIPEELFPKSETFFYGDKCKLKDDHLELLTNNHVINACKLKKAKGDKEGNEEDIIKKLKDENKILRDNISNDYEFEKEESANSCYASSLEFLQQGKYFLLSTDILNDSNSQDKIKIAKLKIKVNVEITEEEEDPITKVKNTKKSIITVYRNFEFDSSKKDKQFSDFDAHFKIIPNEKEKFLLKEPEDDSNQTIHFNIEIEFESGREETISNKLIWNGRYFLHFESKGYFSEEDSYGTTYKPTGYGIQMLGIADYRKVVSTISRYIPAEVAHIENVMASEFREKVTTKETSTEIKEFESTDTEIENLKETTTNDRFQMQNEVAQILNEQRKNDVNTNSTINGTGYSFNLTTGNSTQRSKEDSNKQAVTTAKEVTNKAVEKIVSKVKKERTVTVTEKFIDVNKYGFDNRGNKEHVSGIYRHINAIYRNRIQNYGSRLTLEFSIPEPALCYFLTKNNDELVKILSKIPKPVNLLEKVQTYEKLEQLNYEFYFINYGIEKELPAFQYPIDLVHERNVTNKNYSPIIDLQSTIGFDFKEVKFNGFWNNMITAIPTNAGGPTSANCKIHQVLQGEFAFKINNQPYNFTDPNNYNTDDLGTWNISEITHPILDHYSNLLIANSNVLIEIPKPSLEIQFELNFSIVFTATKQNIQEWKIRTFSFLKKEFDSAMINYENAVSSELKKYIESEKEKDKNKSLGILRQIEIETLKRNCLSYLIDEESTQNETRVFGVDFILNRESFRDIRIIRNKKLDEYTAFVRFLEQAFEWNEMSYSFYSYFWADKNNWANYVNQDSGDQIHKAFLRAGMARVIVTVRPGFNDAVNMYLTTGKIWQGGNLPVYGSSMFVSIAEELRENPDYTVEDEWESVLPTNLIAIQSDGVSIKQQGLPDLLQNGNLGVVGKNTEKMKRKKFLGIF